MRRIAMWSGPRNISTAMMRSFENRADACVVDEPLYAHYLLNAGLNHPGRDEILKSCNSDFDDVVQHLTSVEIPGCQIYYQKHMAHHCFADDPLDWIGDLDNILLVRDPAAMLASLGKVLPEVQIEDTGLPQQLRLLHHLQNNHEHTVVLDSRQVLKEPQKTLENLCLYLDVPFEKAMLEWPSGPRTTDGIWARFWYDSVYESTGFMPWQHSDVVLAPQLKPLLSPCLEIYHELLEFQLT